MTATTRAGIKSELASKITSNGAGGITGAILNGVLGDLVDSTAFNQGAWSAVTPYVINDIVTYGGSAWIAIAPSTNQIPAAGAYWQAWATGLPGTPGTNGTNGTNGATGPAGSGGAALPQTPALTNTFGQGDRRLIMGISVSAGLINSPPYTLTNLIDGVTSGSSYWAFPTGTTAVAGQTMTFDFANGVQPANWYGQIHKVITGFTWIQSATTTHGTWNLAGSNDGVNWTVLNASPFTLGGATTNNYTGYNASSLGFRYYQLQGVSGNASGSPGIYEIQFVVGYDFLDNQQLIPAGATLGQFLRKSGNGYGWSNKITPTIAAVPGGGDGSLIAYWPFDDGQGSTVCADLMGNYPITISASSLPMQQWTPRGLKGNNAYVQTPTITNARTIAVLYRCAHNDAGFIVSGGAGSGNGFYIGGSSTNYNYWIGGGWDVHPMSMRSDGTQTIECNRGGWLLAFVEFDAAHANPIGLGGRYGSSSYALSEFEAMSGWVWNRTLTSSDRTAVYAMAREIARSRGVVLNWQDSSDVVDIIASIGESTAAGRSPIADNSSPDPTSVPPPRPYQQCSIIVGNQAFSSNTFARRQPFLFGVNHTINQGYQSPTTNFGPEFGIATSAEAAQNSRTRHIVIAKHGVGSTFMAASGTTGSAGTVAVSNTWNPSESTHNGCYHSFLQMLYDCDQGLRMEGKGPNLAGILLLIGLNDASDTAYSGTSTNYQTLLAALDTALQTDTGLTGTNAWGPLFLWAVAQAHSPCTGANSTALTAVRTGISNWVTALGSRGTLIATDALALIADGVHFDASGSKSIGASAFTFINP